MRINGNGHGDVMHLGVLEQQVALDLPGVEHFAAQGQDGLGFLVAAHFGTAAGRIAFNQEEFIHGNVAAFAVRELARQHGHTAALAFLDFLAGALAALRCLDHQLRQFPAVVDMGVEPQLQRGAHEMANQPQRVAGIEPLLDLPLELRVQHFGRKHVAGASKHVFGHELDALWLQCVHIDEALDRLKQTFAQAAVVRAAGRGGNQVDVAFSYRRTFFGEGDRPLNAFAFCKGVGLVVNVAVAFKNRDHGIGGKRLFQVIAQAAFVLPALGILLSFVYQLHRHARHQYRLAAQQMLQLAHGQGG